MLQVSLDRYTKGLLTVIAVLLTVIALGLLVHTPSSVATAEAQIPDSGSQRQRMVDQLREVNVKLGQMNAALKGTLKVKVTNVETHEALRGPK